MIEFINVCKKFGSQTILDGLSLTIAKGETCVIVGPSGTGKSVTLRHMIGLLTPDAGSILVAGENAVGLKGRKLEALRHRFGILFQSGALLNWMNVYDNVALPLYENTHLPESEIRRRVSERLAMVGMVGMEHKMPSELSGGMRKRIGLARAIVTDPEIILYDEPTSGLDPVMSRTIDDLVRELQARLGVTSVVVTHDLHSAFAIGDRLIMLSNGKAVFSGTPKEFANSAVPQVREFVEAQFSGGNLISH
jgi:phospholipid/cholesterol/gamma-HCH transport system ATP-binding protein